MIPPIYICISQSHIRKRKPVEGHASYPSDSPIATKLGLRSSLSARALE